MLQAIKYCLANLTNGNGRDARQTFWFYVLFLIIVQFALSFAISIPMTGQAMMAGFHGAQQNASQAEVQAQIMQQMQGSIRISMYVSLVLSLLMIFFLFAAFVRRLHDSNKPGWIAAAVAALQVVRIAFTYSQLDAVLSAMASGNAAAMANTGHPLSSLLGWIPTLVVIVFGVLGPTHGPNAYGEEPDAG